MDYEIGKRIKELRERNHLTRESFAEKIGISSKYIYEIEKCGKNFSVDILLRMVKILSVSCDYIMKGNDEFNDVFNTYCIEETKKNNQEQKIKLKEIIITLMKIYQDIP